MKKIIVFTFSLCTSFLVFAQDTQLQRPYKLEEDGNFMNELLKSISILSVLGLIFTFIVVLVKTHYDYRLKKNMVDRSVPENIVSAFLQKNGKDASSDAIKWVALLLGAGFGLLIVSTMRPLGFSSFAIMCISVALAYLGYYYYVKEKG